MNFSAFFLSSAWILALAAPASAQPGQNQSGEAPSGEDDPAADSGGADETVDLSQASLMKLESGLQVAIQGTSGAPTVSVCTAIAAGSRNDPPDARGAHRALAEILKDGGYRSSSQDYAALIERRGGSSGVAVERDASVFCTTVPASELPLALWVTAGRFTSAALTEEEVSRATHELAERSEELDAEVFTGRAPVRLRKMAFLGSEEYAHPTLAHPDDFDALSLSTLWQLHAREFVAQRAVVAISGGVNEAYAKSQVEEHLGKVRSGTPAPRARLSLLDQTSPRFSMAEDHTTKTPAAWYGWVAETPEDAVAMDAALSILLSDSRLKKKLLSKYGAAKSVELHRDTVSDPKTPSLLRLEVVGRGSSSLGTIEKFMDTELRSIAQQGPTEAELSFVAQEFKRERASLLDTPLGRARALSLGVLGGQTPDHVLSPLSDDYAGLELEKERVRMAALHLLAPHRRSTVEVYPKGWQDPWQAPMPLFHIVERGHTLSSIAQRYGTTVAVITKMNGINQNKPIYPGDKLKVPRGKVKKERPLRTHRVRRGDTLSGLAVKYGVSVRAIADANGMGSKLTIRTGETLRIPWGTKTDSSSSSSKSGSSSSSSSSSGSSSMKTHKVTSGQTLSGIAHQHGVSTVALAQANGISHKAMVRVGQVLKVPPRGSGKTAAPPQIITYTVKKGDTLSGIAARHNVTVAELTVANQISRKSTLRPGQKLKIPKK